MSNDAKEYIVEGKMQSEVQLASQRLREFCKQFGGLTLDEQQECIKRVDNKKLMGLIELRQVLNKYLD